MLGFVFRVKLRARVSQLLIDPNRGGRGDHVTNQRVRRLYSLECNCNAFLSTAIFGTHSMDTLIPVVCPGCQKAGRVNRDFIGRQIRCKRCGSNFLMSQEGTAIGHEPPKNMAPALTVGVVPPEATEVPEISSGKPQLGDVQTTQARAENTSVILKQFREQSLAVGVLWVMFGVLLLLVGVLGLLAGWTITRKSIFWNIEVDYSLIGIGLQGLVYLAAGTGTVLRRRFALLVGLILTYLSLIPSLLLGLSSIPAVLIGVAIIRQAHRVLSWADQLAKSGVPLTTPAPRVLDASALKPSVYANLALITAIPLVLLPYLFFIPMVLGSLGLVDIRRHPQRTGRRKAIAGIVLSVFELAFAIWIHYSVLDIRRGESKPTSSPTSSLSAPHGAELSKAESAVAKETKPFELAPLSVSAQTPYASFGGKRVSMGSTWVPHIAIKHRGTIPLPSYTDDLWIWMVYVSGSPTEKEVIEFMRLVTVSGVPEESTMKLTISGIPEFKNGRSYRDNKTVICVKPLNPTPYSDKFERLVFSEIIAPLQAEERWKGGTIKEICFPVSPDYGGKLTEVLTEKTKPYEDRGVVAICLCGFDTAQDSKGTLMPLSDPLVIRLEAEKDAEEPKDGQVVQGNKKQLIYAGKWTGKQTEGPRVEAIEIETPH